MSPPAERRVPRRVTEQEAKLWRLFVRDAVPLRAEPPPLAPAPRSAAPSPPPGPSRPVSGGPVPAPRAAPAPLRLGHGDSPGVDRRTADRFRRGRMVIDGHLDLHGLTQEAAHSALTAFVRRAFDAERRCLLVVTGKGQRGEGVLRFAVPRWLNDAVLRPMVLSFAHARPQHGGDGALYVLLRRHR